MAPREKMRCPVCGGEMNFHAEKVDYSDPRSVDPELGGALEEFHTCPACGYIEERIAS